MWCEFWRSVNVGQTKMSGCIYSHFESHRSGCFDMYNMMEVNATHGGVGGGAWTSATKQDVV